MQKKIWCPFVSFPCNWNTFTESYAFVIDVVEEIIKGGNDVGNGLRQRKNMQYCLTLYILCVGGQFIDHSYWLKSYQYSTAKHIPTGLFIIDGQCKFLLPFTTLRNSRSRKASRSTDRFSRAEQREIAAPSYVKHNHFSSPSETDINLPFIRFFSSSFSVKPGTLCALLSFCLCTSRAVSHVRRAVGTADVDTSSCRMSFKMQVLQHCMFNVCLRFHRKGNCIRGFVQKNTSELEWPSSFHHFLQTSDFILTSLSEKQCEMSKMCCYMSWTWLDFSLFKIHYTSGTWQVLLWSHKMWAVHWDKWANARQGLD